MTIVLDALGGWGILIILPMLPVIIIAELVYVFALVAHTFAMIPIWFWEAVLGINSNREQDLVTWFLGVEELGIYSPLTDPVGNMFEIPEAREYFIRTVDTGFEPSYGLNPEMTVHPPNDETVSGYGGREDVQGMLISNFY